MSGAICLSELCKRYPRSGGEYHFLGKIFHPAMGFMAGALSVLVGFSAPVALSAMALARYLQTIFVEINTQFVAVVLVLVIAALHLSSLRLESWVQNLLTFLNLSLIIGFLVAGALSITYQENNISFLPSREVWPDILSSQFAVSLMYVTYAYLGWNAAAYILDEVEDGEANVTRSLFLGTGITMVLYICLNALFLISTPLDLIRGKLEVGQIVAHHLFGEPGSWLFVGLITVVLCGSISSTIWTGSRVIQVMSSDLIQFRALSKLSEGGSPYRAIIALTFVIIIYILTSSFESALLFTGFSLSLCSTLCISGIFFCKQPTHPSRNNYPTKKTLFSLANISGVVFTLANTFFLIKTALARPLEAGLGACATIIPVLVYFAFFNNSGPEEEKQSPELVAGS